MCMRLDDFFSFGREVYIIKNHGHGGLPNCKEMD